MIVERVFVLLGPNRYSDGPCLEAVFTPPHGTLGWLGRARAALSRSFPTLFPKPAARTFLPRAAAADLVIRVARELQTRAGAVLQPLSIPPKNLGGRWQIVVPIEEPTLGEAALRASAELLESFAQEPGASPEEIQEVVSRLEAKSAQVLPSPELRSLLGEARRLGIPASVLSPHQLALGYGSRRQVLDARDTRELPTSLREEGAGLIPTALVAGGGALEIIERLVSALRGQGLRVGSATHAGLFLPGQPPAPGSYANRAGAVRVLACPEVDAAVLEVEPEALEREGLPLERAEVTVALELEPEALDILARDERCRVLVLGAELPLSRRYSGERILVGATTSGPIAAHLATGGKAVFLKRRRSMAAEGEERILLGEEGSLPALAAVGAVWGLGFPLPEAKSALEEGGQLGAIR